MLEVLESLKAIDLPYTVRLYGVTEEMFDEMVDEDTKAELFDGVMIVHSPASLIHDDLSGFIRFLMRGYSARRKLGKVLGPDSLIHPATGRKFCPDAYFLKKGRLLVRKSKQFEGSPDLALETLSPSNRDYDLEDKRAAYQEARVGEIWFIDPQEEQVIVDRRRGSRYVEEVKHKGRMTSTVLEGFWLDVAWLWADPLPDEVECLLKILGE